MYPRKKIAIVVALLIVVTASVIAGCYAYKYVESTQNHIDSLNGEIKVHKQTIEDKTKYSNELFKQNEALDSEKAKLEEENKDLKLDKHSLEEVLMEREGTIQELKSKIEELSSPPKQVGSNSNKEENTEKSNENTEEVKDKQEIVKWMEFKMTAYVPSPAENGTYGGKVVTRTGYEVNFNNITYNGYRIIAVDPNIIPLYSIVEIEWDGNFIKAIALDTGSAIKGNVIDLLVGDYNTMNNIVGRSNVKLRIIGKG